MKEVVIMTDRCGGQYYGEKNFFQLAKMSAAEGWPILKHLFACVSRFKGDHDAEGKVVKELIRRLVQEGWPGTTAWDFFESTKKNGSFSKDNPGKNHLNKRSFHYVEYSKSGFEEKNRGEHEGHIIYANMNNPEGSDPLKETKQICMVHGFPKDYLPPAIEDCINDAMEDARDTLYKLEKKMDHPEDNEQFLSRIKQDG